MRANPIKVIVPLIGALGCAVLIAACAGSRPHALGVGQTTRPDPGGTATGAAERISADLSCAPNVNRKVVVYYFHRTERCPTCLEIEKLSREAVEAEFTAALRDGSLEFKAVNIEAPGNEHYERDFELSVQSLVLQELLDGRQNKWKNLEQIWELYSDRGAFIAYVQSEIRAFMAGR